MRRQHGVAEGERRVGGPVALPARAPATVTVSGPRNSMVTAMPSGIRANAW